MAATKWWKKTEVRVALIGAAAVIAVPIINRIVNGKALGKGQTLSQQATGSSGSIQQGNNSSASIRDSFNQTTVNNYGPRTTFLKPDDETLKLLTEHVMLFCERYPTGIIRVEVEHGSTARKEVAAQMGVLLQAKNAGVFWNSLNVGVAPDAPITVFHAPQQMELAVLAASTFRPYVHGKVAVKEDRHLSGGTVRFYLNGSVTFSTNGQALFE